MSTTKEEETSILFFEPDLTLDNINTRIQQEKCDKTLEEVSDKALMCEYKESKSVKNQLQILSDILEKHKVETVKKEKIISEYFPNLIPAGLKGVLRGKKLNFLVKKKILTFTLPEDRFEICFEKQCAGHETPEIPDWYILDKESLKVIIGMNQVALWGGGQQLNRGFKYVESKAYNNLQRKLLCVVCNDIIIKSARSKEYRLFKIGFENNTLCYMKNLQNIIFSFFNLNMD